MFFIWFSSLCTRINTSLAQPVFQTYLLQHQQKHRHQQYLHIIWVALIPNYLGWYWKEVLVSAACSIHLLASVIPKFSSVLCYMINVALGDKQWLALMWKNSVISDLWKPVVLCFSPHCFHSLSILLTCIFLSHTYSNWKLASLIWWKKQAAWNTAHCASALRSKLWTTATQFIMPITFYYIYCHPVLFLQDLLFQKKT